MTLGLSVAAAFALILVDLVIRVLGGPLWVRGSWSPASLKNLALSSGDVYKGMHLGSLEVPIVASFLWL